MNKKRFNFFTLNFLVPPKWIHEPQDVQGVVGQDIILPCLVEGYPDPITVWTRANGKQFLSVSEIKFVKHL